MIRMVLLNAKQMAELLHDYIATNAKTLSGCKRVERSGTFIDFTKNDVKMICDFAYNNECVYDLKELLYKLPHSGFNAFSLSNKEIKGIINNQFPMIEELNFNHKKIKYIFGNCIRFMTLNGKEMIEILHKQLFEYVGDMISAHSKNCHLRINIVFDGNNSHLIFYSSDCALDFDLSKLAELSFSTIKNDFKYIELDKEELEKIIKTSGGIA